MVQNIVHGRFGCCACILSLHRAAIPFFVVPAAYRIGTKWYSELFSTAQKLCAVFVLYSFYHWLHYTVCNREIRIAKHDNIAKKQEGG